MGLGAALAGVIGGPLLATGGFGLVAGISAALVLPLAVVWLHGVRVSGRGVPDQQDEGGHQGEDEGDLEDDVPSAGSCSGTRRRA